MQLHTSCEADACIPMILHWRGRGGQIVSCIPSIPYVCIVYTQQPHSNCSRLLQVSGFVQSPNSPEGRALIIRIGFWGVFLRMMKNFVTEPL